MSHRLVPSATAVLPMLALMLLGSANGCTSNSDTSSALSGIDSIMFLQRPARNDSGNVFDYTSYLPGARLVKLSPPTADGTLTVLCCDKAGSDFANIDISNYDLSFDAKTIVFSGKLTTDQKYGLFVLTIADGSVAQLPTDPSRDYIAPIYLPGDKILFTTNEVVEEGAPQHRDEYERATTLQLGVMNADGTGERLGARNLSHRVFPTLASDGRVMFTQWDHLGTLNEGDLMFINPDLTQMREGFGKEGTGVTNSYLKAREISPGRMIAIGTSRDRTIQAGSLIDVRLGKTSVAGGVLTADTEMSEANATYRVLTPDVPLDRSPSSNTVGRYYDAFPLDAGEFPNLLVSWADGPVETSTLAAAGLSADFGVYLYDSEHQTRRPIWNDTTMWDVFPRPLVARTAPPEIAPSAGNGFSTTAGLMGTFNVYDSTLFPDLVAGSVYGVRVMEGFSSEEGFPEDFGTTMFEGHTQLGVVPLQSDNSWAALVPADVPIHTQLIDKFGMSLANEPVWFSATKGESRFCGGCHESRSATSVIQPGLTQAIAAGPAHLLEDTPRTQRVSTTYTRDAIRGVPWDLAVQPILDAKCVSCHNGQPGTANPTYTVTDPATGDAATWTFDLSGAPVNVQVGGLMVDGYANSYVSLAGLDPEAVEKAQVVISGNYQTYMKPMDARDAMLFTLLNPPQQYPTQDANTRAFSSTTHAQMEGFTDLTPDEYYVLLLSNEMGALFYSRENAPLAAYTN